ncbi:restriction endonuclease subunit S [Isoptericola sp. NPDC019482]|uniref:restriction endonuclease subunit S n=1 Tax=Isoptericola sp. NPDC019482 TaxID=3154688 RepID=UPI003479D399
MTVEWVPIGEVLAFAEVDEVVDPQRAYPIMGVLGQGRGILVRDAIRGSDTAYKTLRKMRAGHVVFSRLKAFEGAFAVVPDWADGMFASNEFPSFQANKEMLDVDWFAHLLHTSWFQERVRGLSQGIGARRERLSVSSFCSIRIPLPDLPTQQGIAARLDRIAHLTHGVARSAEPLSVARARLLRDVLEGGRPRPLGELLARRTDEVEVESTERYPMLGMRNRGRGPFDAGMLEGSATKYSRLRKVHSGDLVYLKLGAWEGAFGIVPDGLDGRHTSPEFISYRLDGEHVDSNFLKALVSWDSFATKIGGLSKGTNLRRRRLTPEAFEALEIPLPSIEAQQIVGRRLNILDQIERLSVRRDELGMSLIPAARNEEFRRLLEP